MHGSARFVHGNGRFNLCMACMCDFFPDISDKNLNKNLRKANKIKGHSEKKGRSCIMSTLFERPWKRGWHYVN